MAMGIDIKRDGAVIIKLIDNEGVCQWCGGAGIIKYNPVTARIEEAPCQVCEAKKKPTTPSEVKEPMPDLPDDVKDLGTF